MRVLTNRWTAEQKAELAKQQDNRPAILPVPPHPADGKAPAVPKYNPLGRSTGSTIYGKKCGTCGQNVSY